tara:strand:- start:163 stop:450 length:288 start_codon:yes stop_codon:yes gene_type:complete
MNPFPPRDNTETLENEAMQDQHPFSLEKLRGLDGSGPWLHEPSRRTPSRRWPAYLVVFLCAMLLAAFLASIATAASTAIAQIQIMPHLALHCGAC